MELTCKLIIVMFLFFTFFLEMLFFSTSISISLFWRLICSTRSTIKHEINLISAVKACDRNLVERIHTKLLFGWLNIQRSVLLLLTLTLRCRGAKRILSERYGPIQSYYSSLIYGQKMITSSNR